MIHVSHLNKSFGGQVILSDVTFAINPGEKTALVGLNGCGKTTLLRMICSEEPYSGGNIVLGPSCRLGYLGQEGQLNNDHTLYTEMSAAFEEITELETLMRELEDDMSRTSDEAQSQRLLNKYSALQSRYEHAEPHLMDAKIRTVLHGLGFTNSDLDRRCGEFSGGWQMRGAMARMLLREPDLLLLDEPTNHLDLGAVEWLEEYACKTTASILLVSHDRYFLDRVVNRTLELRDGQVHDYAGNYTYYLEEREKRRELQQAAYDNQQKQVAQDQRFVDRFRYKANLATRVQSRIKLMEKRELVAAPDRDQRALKASFVTATTSGREVLTVTNLQKAYGERRVLTGLSLEVNRGERVALVGPNGVGKSTLLRLLANIEKPDQGTIKSGYKIAPVYYAQHQAEALDQSKTVLQEMEAVAQKDVDQTRIRTILGCLLFSGEDVYKEISVLSGGERSRVALARCILTPSNLLLLDEPTNHLDITSRQALLDALEDYPGTIIIVTHDRHFMNALANIVVDIRDGQAHRYLGNYDDFQHKRNLERQQLNAAQQAEQKRSKAKPKLKPARKSNQSGIQTIHWKLEPLEKRICQLEAEIAELAEQLADPALYHNGQEAKQKQELFQAKQAEVEELTTIWDEMTSE